MKKFTTFETQLGESVVLTDKAKLSLYKKSSNSGIAVDILEEVYRRGFAIWGEQFGGTPDSFAFDRVNSFIAGGFAAQLDEDLLDEKRGLWDNIHAKRKRIKAGSGERMRKPGSKGAPTDAAIRASQNEDTDPCWKGYKQIGMKTKGGRKVPNCVPVKEQSTPSVEQIAKKHDVTVASIKKAVVAGGKVEKEHTKSTKQAERIARDHLKERPDYYEKLKKMEKTPIEEGKIKNAASKSLKAALIGSNLVAAGSAFDTDSTKTPGHAIVQTASALPGVAGWGATVVHYGLKGIDKAKEYMKPGKKKMNEERLNRIAELKASLYGFLENYNQVDEATYQGKTVPLNKPMKGDVKKSKVYVDPDGDGKAQKVNFGDPNMSIKKDQPGRKKSYCARSGGIKGTSDKTSANYWSRKAWDCKEETLDETSLLKKIKYTIKAAGQQSRIAKELRPNEVESDKKYQKRKKGLDRVFKEQTVDESWSSGPKYRPFTMGKNYVPPTPEQSAKIKNVIDNMKVPGPKDESPEARARRIANNVARQRAAVGMKEDAEVHSKDSKKPSSRFDGSNELVANYKKDTPGQDTK